MMKLKYLVALFAVLPLPAQAEIFFVQSRAGAIAEVPTDKIQKICKKNFLFRELKKDEAPEYLYKEIIKAAFRSEMVISFDELVAGLKASNGKCAWVTAEELQKLK